MLYNWQHCHSLLLTLDSRWYTPWVSSLQLLPPFFSIRMDENYNFLPHGVNLQDAIFPDTQENRRIFSSLFQFSKCSQGQQLATFFSDWEVQEDTRVRNGYTCATAK